MRILIITVAGMSKRFASSIGEGAEVVKCLYSSGDKKDTLLYEMLRKSTEIDKYIIVGGYKYSELKVIIEREFSEFESKIIMVENTMYEEYGSGYSLYKGLEKAMESNFDEIIFAEGDLYVDEPTYKNIVEADRDVISINADDILANKAVALYLDEDNNVNYIYDTQHGVLKIDKPFVGIFNSGQIWKFSDSMRVREKYGEMKKEEWKGTNLVFVQKYFEDAIPKDYLLIKFNQWINCNTIEDYEKIKQWRKMDENYN